jgi:pilus assembly protein CpaB
MRAKSMVLILIALGCGLVASIGISQVMDRSKGGGDQAAETEKILVANVDIDIGVKLDAENVKMEDWPKDKIPFGAVTDWELIEEQFARARLYEGEPILLAKVMDSPGEAVLIPEGYRAVPVKVEQDTMSESVMPGDRVDVLVFLRKGGDVAVTSTITVLRDVRVFAVGRQTVREEDPEGKAISAKTVSLLVKPTQVETLLLASEMGKIRLSLRGYNDLSADPQRGATTVPDLLGRSGDSGSDRELNPLDSIRAAGTPRQEGFTEFVQRVANQSNTAEAQTAALRDDIAWTMVLDTPQGPVEYRWRSGQSLPESGSSGSSGAPATHTSPPATTPSPASNPSTPEPPEPSTTPSDDEPSDPFTPPTDTDS